jgi:hypothetical protein
MTSKLTETQRKLLIAARQRDDRLLTIPSTLKGGAAQKVGASLIAAGAVKEIKAKSGAPVWRRDAETGKEYALKLTAAGVKAVAIETAADAGEAPRANPPSEEEADVAAGPSAKASAPREGSKISKVVALLERDSGATLEELIAATGWLPHTSRAALTGLRKRGYAIERQTGAAGHRGYVIVAVSQPQAA